MGLLETDNSPCDQTWTGRHSTNCTHTITVFDPDGWEREIPIVEAEVMAFNGEAIFCSPDLEDDDEIPDHYHKHERWNTDG